MERRAKGPGLCEDRGAKGEPRYEEAGKLEEEEEEEEEEQEEGENDNKNWDPNETKLEKRMGKERKRDELTTFQEKILCCWET